MSLTKNDLSLECKSCQFGSGSGDSCFQLSVPVEDLLTGRKGMAFVECIVEGDEHRLTLLHIQDPSGEEMQLSDDEIVRLGKCLEFVAEKKLCGSEKLCPDEVVHQVRLASQAGS